MLICLRIYQEPSRFLLLTHHRIKLPIFWLGLDIQKRSKYQQSWYFDRFHQLRAFATIITVSLLAIPTHHHRVKKTVVYEPLPSSWLIMVKTAANL
tara:strand:+ start:1298 stop:1585 length:288 start_codon:yes stop_codon:yes gene_type:complete